jgi:hypothetical protein
MGAGNERSKAAPIFGPLQHSDDPMGLFLRWTFAAFLLLDEPPVSTVCICEKAKVADGWCDVCGFGFVAGLKIPSRLLFTTIDHGHDIGENVLRCETCRKARESDGFCSRCRIGFSKNKIYLSSFTHCLAKGTRIKPGELRCETCRKHVDEGGWCDACKRGVFGNVAVAESEHFDEAAAAFRRLKLGLAHLKQCELCGIAMYADGMCPRHRLVYQDGRGTPE